MTRDGGMHIEQSVVGVENIERKEQSNLLALNDLASHGDHAERGHMASLAVTFPEPRSLNGSRSGAGYSATM
jgi:hypothetical protein